MLVRTNNISNQESAPSVPEMREMLARAGSLDFFQHGKGSFVCSKCGATQTECWVVVRGVRKCFSCEKSQ